MHHGLLSGKAGCEADGIGEMITKHMIEKTSTSRTTIYISQVQKNALHSSTRESRLDAVSRFYN